MAHSAETLVDRIAAIVRGRLPAGVTPDYFDGFLSRNRAALVAVVAEKLERRTTGSPTGTQSEASDLWTPGQRTAANLAAMRIAASKHAEEMSADDRRALAAYSGWGGLSIQS